MNQNEIQNKNFQRRDQRISNKPIELTWKYHLINQNLIKLD